MSQINIAETGEMTQEARLALRNAFGSFATGVTVITTRQADGTPRGFTANSFTSVSLDPPLLLVCLAKTALSCPAFAEAAHFAVNILSDQQKEVSGLFASQSPDKFGAANWHAGPQDMPIIDGALTSFTCARHQLVDAGDHLVLIGRVLSHASSAGKPLGFFRGNYFDIGLESSLADAAARSDNMSIAAVLTRGEAVLLEDAGDGNLTVPKAPSSNNSVRGLAQRLEALGLRTGLDHLYAVFRNSADGAHEIIYHGTVTGKPPRQMTFHDLDALPLDRISSDAERSMLQRYQREYRHGSFGIYHGTETSGVVNTIADQTEYHT